MTAFAVVNGVEISIERALGWRAALSDTALMDETARAVGVMQYARENGLSASREEIEEQIREMRYAMDLEKAEDLRAWMTREGVTEPALRETAEIGVLQNKIRESITDADLQPAFTESQATMEYVELYSLTVEDEDLAQELRAQIEEEEDSFYNLAVEHSVDGATFRQGGFMGDVTREMVRGEAEAAIFGASDGALVGPIKEGEDYTLYLVRRVVKPSFEDVKETMRDEAFEDLLESFVAAAAFENKITGARQESPGDDEALDEDDDDEAEVA